MTQGKLVRALPTHMDAWQRAVRTFLAGLFVVALTAASTAFVAGVAGGIRWTREYWTAVGLAVGVAVVNAAVSYVLRYLKPPAQHDV